MWHNIVLFCNLLLIEAIVAGEVGEKCAPTEKMRDGTCKLATNCEAALRSIKKNRSHPFSRCGFIFDTEIVCCPNDQTGSKFGDIRGRIADKECLKIKNDSVPPLGLHIIGGEAASLGEFPHMAALGYDTNDGYEFKCGGSIISDTYILTAAHCVDNQEAIPPTIARLGVVERGEKEFNSESDYRIEDTIIHPKYMRPAKYHDLALLRLETPVRTSVNLNAICLYTNDDNPVVPLTVTGWGKISRTQNKVSKILMKANVTVVDSSVCWESYTNNGRLTLGITKEQLCAGDPQGLYDTCQGDSGGPLQILNDKDGFYRLVGVTSFGRGCGSPIPGVYIRIARYLDWIESVVWPARK